MTQVNTNNFPIPNDTGANVLADINENLEALQTNNAGGSAPAVGRANQFFVDTSTTPDTLKIRGNTDNASFITLGNIETNLGMIPKAGGTFTGNIQTAAGTKVSPSIQLAAANTGLYKPGTDVIGLSCGGNDIAYVDPNGIEIKDGKKLVFRDSGNSNVVTLQAPALTSDVNLTLPPSDGDAGDVLKTDGNGATSWTSIAGVPRGSIFPYAGATPPSGYLECNGDHVSKTDYAQLYAIVGDIYSAVTPPSGQFFLPDLRGQFIRGWDHGRGVDPSRTRGSDQNDSNKSHTHTGTSHVSDSGHLHHAFHFGNAGELRTQSNLTSTSQAASGTGAGHLNEAYNITRTDAAANVGRTSNVATGISVTTTIANDGGAESRPKNMALMYIIKT